MSEVQGYLGYKNTPARGSVGRFFLDLRKPRAKPVGLRFLKLRKRSKEVGPRFLKIKTTLESGGSVSLKIWPARVNALYPVNTPTPALPPTCAINVHLAHKKTPTPLGPP